MNNTCDDIRTVKEFIAKYIPRRKLGYMKKKYVTGT